MRGGVGRGVRGIGKCLRAGDFRTETSVMSGRKVKSNPGIL